MDSYQRLFYERAQRGAALLDRIAPAGWEARVAAPGLNVAHLYACPLARAINDPTDAGYDHAEALAFPEVEPVARHGVAKQYGFYLSCADVDGPEYQALTFAWRMVIAERQRVEVTA